MTTNWNLYERKLEINGSTIKDRNINYMRNSITSNFSNSPSYRSAYFNDAIFTTDIQVIDTDDYFVKKVLMKPDDSINIGDKIVFDAKTWLCIGIDDTNPVYEFGTVYLSSQNITLNKNNTIYTYPVVVDGNVRLYSMGYKSNKYLTIPESSIIVYIKNDNITVLIERDEVFSISNDNYKVVDINRLVMPGLIVLKMEYCIEDAETHVYTIEILNGSTINLQQNNTLQLNINTYDNGQLLSPSPTLTYTSSNREICTVSTTGLVTAIALGSCVISVSANGVSDSITVNVVEEDIDNYTYTLSSASLPDDEIKIGSAKTYVAQKYNNGVAINQAFTFSISGDATAYQLTTIDDNTCAVKALNSGVSIVLQATDDSDNTKITTKTISLKSLF